MRAKLSILLLTLTVAAMIVNGCGDEADSDPSPNDPASSGSSATGESAPKPITASSLGKSSYVKQANSICVERREERIDAIRDAADDRPQGSNPTVQDEFIVDIVHTIFVPTMETQMAEMRDLGAPRGDEEEVEAIILAFEESVDEAKNMTSQKEKAPVDRAFSRAGELALAYGMEECALG